MLEEIAVSSPFAADTRTASLRASIRFARFRGIGARLALGFGALGLLLLVLALISITRINAVSARMSNVLDERLPRLTLLQQLSGEVGTLAKAANDALAAQSPAAAEAHLMRIQEGRGSVGKRIGELQAVFEQQGEAGRSAAEEIGGVSGNAVSALVQFSRVLKSGENELAQTVMRESLQPKLSALSSVVDTYQAQQLKELQQIKQELNDLTQNAKWLLLAAVAAGALIAAVFAWRITRSVTVPLNEAVAALRQVEAGNLAIEVSATRTDEVGQLLGALGSSVSTLRAVVQQVRTGVESVSTASGQIAAGNRDLNSRTEQQASSLQQTATSMEQLTSTVKQSADNARQANQLAMSASEAAAKGGAIVGQVVSTMEEITASSSRIADIIGVIDGIAFQTNILALNAAVEAARAGEQGRGFAVVAAEVRNLAQRCAQAAREIKSLIGDSVEKVDAGSKQVADAGKAMAAIVGQVRRVTDLIGEISSAAMEQSAGIGQVNTAVTQMDQVTQRNAALVEQSAAAADSLKDQAERLAEAVSVFKLRAGEAGATSPRAGRGAAARPQRSAADAEA